MLPTSDDIPGGGATGEPSGGGQEQQPPVLSGKLDDILIVKLKDYRAKLREKLEQWVENKPNQKALETLIKNTVALEADIYSQYRDEKEPDPDRALLLKELSDRLRLAAFGLRNMRDAGGRIPPQEELELHDSLRELDLAIELAV
jgi:hypothetical protein